MVKKERVLERWLDGGAGEYIPICNNCVHVMRSAPAIKCSAYPEGIPIEILTGKVDHHKPYKGDHGIQFSPKAAKK
jgi:hypothetical protein